MPLLAPHIRDATEYQKVKQAAEAVIQDYASQLDRRKLAVALNTADNVANDAVYLTLTGTSAEMGDDGAVGRGNRVNGVIAPFRATSLEAACGKNSISHVGKVYNVLALLAAQDIIERVPAVRAATVYVLPQIDGALDEPLVATAMVCPADGALTPSIQADVESVLDEHLDQVNSICGRMLSQKLTLF